MGILFQIRNHSGQMVDGFSVRNEGEFRLIYFDGDIPKVLGEMPWSTIRKPLRDFARGWAEKQPESKIEAFLDQRVAGHKVRKALANLDECKIIDTEEAKATFENDYGKRDGSIILDFVSVFIRALLPRLRAVLRRPTTLWEYTNAGSLKPEGMNRVREWLFRRRAENE